jgi:hypothetical protein
MALAGVYQSRYQAAASSARIDSRSFIQPITGLRYGDAVHAVDISCS